MHQCSILGISTEQNKTKPKNMYKPTKRIINWRKAIHFIKLFYTKVSRK